LPENKELLNKLEAIHTYPVLDILSSFALAGIEVESLVFRFEGVNILDIAVWMDNHFVIFDIAVFVQVVESFNL
jgi:hypothetical protein